MNKKKVIIVTYHFAHNYGAVLQTYATQTALIKLGFDVEVLDYIPKYHTELYEPKRDLLFGFCNVMGNSLYHKNIIVRLLASVKSVYLNHLFNKNGAEYRREKKYIYSNFVEEYLNLTTIKYYTLKQLKENPPKCHGLVSGSDQIWNWRLTNRQFDDVYFLQFGDLNIKRCIYAASLGTTSEQECYEHVKKLDIDINNISFREKAVCDRYNRLSAGNYISVADPTMLLSASDYNKISKSKYKIPQSYILAYILVKNVVLENTLHKLIECTGLRVVEISPRQMYEGSEYYVNIEPNEFPSFFRDAEYVVTNSFHGTAFALIYNRELICGANPNSKDDRITSLLNTCNIPKRFINSIEDIEGIIENKINFDMVNSKLADIRKQGIEFLKKSLNN